METSANPTACELVSTRLQLDLPKCPTLTCQVATDARFPQSRQSLTRHVQTGTIFA